MPDDVIDCTHHSGLAQRMDVKCGAPLEQFVSCAVQMLFVGMAKETVGHAGIRLMTTTLDDFLADELFVDPLNGKPAASASSSFWC